MNRRLYDYDEAADALRVDKSWLQRHIKRLPHVKFGRDVLFTDADLDEITELHHHRPQQAVPASASAADTSLVELKPLRRRGA
jgi:excisionase family DNA binding protein